MSSPTRPVGRVASRPPTVAGRHGAIGWWYAGMILDLVHMPLIIGLVFFGASIWAGAAYFTIVTILVILQIGLMGCPVMFVTRWMKRKYDPTYNGPWSLTMWMFRRYGRLVGVGIFVLFITAALALRALLF